ncbi:MAG: O-antigen ligase family protein [candidate division Zixibacteria bacterium]|nr:O-antigen ligase family protein [candidate division Zixibacteria bacterium]
MSLSIAAGARYVEKRKLFQFLGLAAGFSLAALLFALFGFKLAAAELAAFLLLALGFLDYPKFLLSAVFIRSALDAFTNTGLPLGPLNLNPAGLLGLLLIFFTGIHGFNNKEILRFPVAKGFLLFLLFSTPALFSAFWNFGAEGAVAVKEFIRLASLFCLLVSLLAFFKTPKETKKLFYVSLASLVVPLGVGFYQVLTGTGDTFSTAGQNRIFGTLFHPNTFALYLSVFLAVALAWHKVAPTFRKKVLLGILLAAQFLTFSLSGLAATAAVFGMHFWAHKNFKILLLGTVLFTIPLALSANWKTRFEQVAGMKLTEEIQTGEISNSFSWRVLHWYVLLQYAKEHPVTGWGLLTTEKITPWKTPEGQGYAAHNDFVRLFLESGLVGLTGYFIFLFHTGRWIFRRKEEAGPKAEGRLAPVLKAVFAVLILLSAGAAEPLVHTPFVYYFLTFIALAKAGFAFPLTPARNGR